MCNKELLDGLIMQSTIMALVRSPPSTRDRRWCCGRSRNAEMRVTWRGSRVTVKACLPAPYSTPGILRLDALGGRHSCCLGFAVALLRRCFQLRLP